MKQKVKNTTRLMINNISYVIPYAAKSFFKKKYVAFVFLALLIIITRIIVLLKGFTSVSADEFSRILMSASWAKEPYAFEVLFFRHTSIWLPGHFYLLGIPLKFYYNLILTPHIITFLFSLLSIVMVYLLAREMFNHWVALLTILMVSTLKIHVYLSLTPMAEMIYFTFIISFIYFFLISLKSNSNIAWIAAALMLAFATSIRYEAWIMAIIFSCYLTINWIVTIKKTESLQTAKFLAICISCYVPFMWIIGNFIVWGDFFHFAKFHTTTLKNIGLLTDYFPAMAHFDILLQNGAIVFFISLAGIILFCKYGRMWIWLYIALSFAPLFFISILAEGVGVAYHHRFVGQYLILLSPFCAYFLYLTIFNNGENKRPDDKKLGKFIEIIILVYNPWVVYLGVFQNFGFKFVLLMVMMGSFFSFFFLSLRKWLFITLSTIPILILILITKMNTTISKPDIYFILYYMILFAFYAYFTLRLTAVDDYPTKNQLKIAGFTMLFIICFFNLYDTYRKIPHGMPAEDIKTGFYVRQLFAEGVLKEKEKILVEVVGRNYKCIQVISNNPGKIIIDRHPYNQYADSFLLSENNSPYTPFGFFANYEKIPRTTYTNDQHNINDYIFNNQIKVIVFKDPRIEALLYNETDFQKIYQVDNYKVFMKGKSALDYI